MGDPQSVMQTILHPSHIKGEQVSAMKRLIELLQKQDCLKNVLDECYKQWRDLTGLLWDNSDYTMKTTASMMLARIGAVAVQYARLASSVIPSNILFAWIEPYLYKSSTSSDMPWDETVLLYMLDILRLCLADLEGSAFKASAPGLLNGCLAMLGSKDTPIGHFGALLEVLVQLTKVPTCIRPKFRDIVDLLVGWGVCSDTPANARPKLIRTFQSLSFGWDMHTDLAASLLDGMAADLTTLVSSQIKPMDHTEYLNTGLCLAVIYESSGSLLALTVLETIPQIVELHISSLLKYTPHITQGDPPTVFARELYAQTQALVSVVASKALAHGTENGVGSINPAQGVDWCRELCGSILEVANKKLCEVVLKPSEVSCVLLIHASLIVALQQHATIVDIEEKLRWYYGDHSTCFSLRFYHSKHVVQHLTVIYTTLTSWPSARLRRSFVEIFLRDLQPSIGPRPGGHALPLISPESRNTVGDDQHAMDTPESKGHIQKTQNGCQMSNGQTASSRGHMRKALFACAMLTHVVQANVKDNNHRDEVQRIWVVVSNEITKPGGMLQHKKLIMHAVHLLQTVFKWLLDSGDINSGYLISTLDFMGLLLRANVVVRDTDLTKLLLEWVKQAISIMKPCTKLSSDLAEVVIQLASHCDERIRQTAGETLSVMTSSCLQLTGQTLLKLAAFAAECSSDNLPEVSTLYRQLLMNLSPYALLLGAQEGKCSLNTTSFRSRIAWQTQSHVFRPNQLTTFLQHLYQTDVGKGPSMRLLQGSRSGEHVSQDWILAFCQSLAAAQGSEMEWEQQTPVVENLVRITDSQSNYQHAMWFLVHEAARNIVASRFRICNGGPSQFFAALDGALSSQITKLAEDAPSDLQNTWMLLEFISALEQKCFCGYEGSEMLASPPRNTWQFYLSNRKVFVEWFARLRSKLLFISQKIGHHHYTVRIGMLRIHQLEAEQRKVMNNASEDIPDETCSALATQLSDALMRTSLSLCKLEEADTIKGLLHFIASRSPPFLIPPNARGQPLTETPIGWMHGLALQANGHFEEAVYAYNEYYTYARRQDGVLGGMAGENNTRIEARQKSLIAKIITKDFQPFIQQRIAECFYGTADWKGYQSFIQAVEQQNPITNELWWKLRQIELSAVYDTGMVKDAFEKMNSWAPESESIGVDEALNFGEVYTLHALIRARSPDAHPTVDIPTDLRVCEQKLAPVMETLAPDNPSRLATHLLYMHGLKCASRLVKTPDTPQQIDASTSVMTLFDLVSGSQSEAPQVGLGVLRSLVPEVCKEESGYQFLTQLSISDVLKLARIQRASGGDLAPLLLLGCHIARGKGNMRLASRLLNDDVIQSVQPAWIRALAVLENREMTLAGCPPTNLPKVLAHWWESAVWGLHNVSQDDSSRIVHAVSLERLSAQLVANLKSNPVTDAVASFGIDLHLISSHLGASWSQVNAAAGGSLSYSSANPHSKTRVAQAVCSTAAVVVSPQTSTVWKQFGHMLYTLAQETSEKVESNGSDVSSDPLAGYRHAINAYCKYLQLHGHSADYFTLLRLHDMIQKHGHCLLGPELQQNLMAVPASAWRAVSTQVFTQLSNSSTQVRQCMVQILKAVSRVDMSSVLYPAVVEKRKVESEGTSTTEELQALLADLNTQYPFLCKDLNIMLDEMERLTILWVEQWHSTLAELHLDVNRRIVTFQAEMGRLRKNDRLDQHQRAAITQQRFGALFSPVFAVLEKRLRSTLSREPQTPHEQDFRDQFAGQLADSIGKFKDLVVEDPSQAQGLWAPLKDLLRDMDKHLKILNLKMASISPRLTSLSGTDIPLPGCKGVQITVNGFGPDVLVLSTKTRPKKLEMIGSDGQKYSYLLKGRDDLRMDHRLMQFVNATNSLLALDKQTGSRGYQAREYSITPLGGRVGLIQWVSGTVSLYGVFRSWQKNQQDKIEAVNAAQADAEANKQIMVPPAAQMRPTDLFYAHLFQELNKANIARGSSSRKDWPMDVMLKVFKVLQDHIPSKLLANELWCGSSSSSSWWARTKSYINSSSVTSMVGFILGLGDRHLDNLLIDRVSAEVVHIDYDVCFEKGTNSRIPEVVPFRMTRTMQVAMGIGGLKGSFYWASIRIMQVLRDNKDSLWMLLEAILNDPIVDWAAERHERAARKGMDLAVNLQLFESRCQELQGRLEVPRQELLISLEISAEYTQSCFELHTYMSDVCEKIRTSITKVAEAQTLLSSIASEEQELNEKCKMPQELNNKHFQDLQKLQESVQQVLSHCHQWAFRHSRVVKNLGDVESPVLMLPHQQWRSQSTITSLELMNQSGQFPSQAIMNATFGGSQSKAGTTPQLVEKCMAVDEQGSKLLPHRDDLVLKIKAIMQEYTTVLRYLLPKNYFATSHHCRWMVVFQSALGGLPVEGVEAAQQLVPKEPTDVEVEFMWTALTTAYCYVAYEIEQAETQPKATPALIQVEQDAAARSSAVQKGLASEWSAEDVSDALRIALKEVLDRLSASDDSQEALKDGVNQQCGSDSVTFWTREVFGVAQLFRLLRASTVGQMALIGINKGQNASSMETSTGYSWLDALEKYTSNVSLAFRNIQTGLLVDLSALVEEGPVSSIEILSQRLQDHCLELQSLAQKAWALEDLRQEQEEFVPAYNQKVSEAIHALQEVNIRASNSMVSGPELQDLAAQQQMLTDHIQGLQAHWESRESLIAHLKQETDSLHAGINEAVSRFLKHMQGLAHNPANVGESPDENDLNWGQMDFSCCHACIEPLNLLASAEVHIGPYLQLQREHTPSKPPGASNPAEAESNEIEVHFPPHWQQYTCHMEHASWLNNVVQAGLSERLKVNQTGAQEGQVSQVLENELMKGISQRLLVVAGGLMKSGLRGMLNSASQERDMPAMEDGESLTTSSKMAGAEIKEDGSQQADGEAALDSGDKAASRIIQVITGCFQICIDAQGLFAHSALSQRSTNLWVDSMVNSQVIRLHNLAAFQWFHEDVISRIPGQETSGYLTAYFQQIADARDVHNDMIQKPMGRRQSVEILKNALLSLSQTQSSILEWSQLGNSASESLFTSVQQALVPDVADAQADIKVLQGYLNHRTRWLDSAYEHAESVASLGHALLQFEYSRQGVLWDPGEAPSSQSFADFAGWLLQMDTCVKGLKSSSEELDQHQSKASELAKLRDQASTMLQSTQEEELNASKELNESTTIYLQSISDVVQALGNLTDGLTVSRIPIEQDLGPLLKELLSITHGHKVTRDAHELVSRVLTEYSGLEQTIEKISSLAPSLAERLAHIIDPVVSDEHSRNDAASMAALLEQTACFLLDDTQLSPQLSELMASSLQAFTSLGNIYSALDSLMEATKSIAAALQSEHGLDDETSDLDGQLESVRFNQIADNQAARGSHGAESDGEEELCHATNQIFLNYSKRPVRIKTEVRLGENGHKRFIDTDHEGEVKPVPKGNGSLEASHTEPQAILPPSPLASPLHEAQVQAANAEGSTVSEQKEKTTRDPEGGNQQSILRRMSQEQRSYVAAVSRRCLAKLEGRDVNAEEMDTVGSQVDRLLHQATNPENLCRMYEGWTPWI